MRSPARQRGFRWSVAFHALLVASVGTAVALGRVGPAVLGQTLLIAGILEGATLLGWRLTQMPKSQSLEFLLVSPVQPHRVFLAEAAVGLVRTFVVTLVGLPLLFVPLFAGQLDLRDLLVFILMPWTWGAITGLGLTAWAYQPVAARRWGELFSLVGILLYITLGILAGEKLYDWLALLPDAGRYWFMELFGWFHTLNPFAVMQFWFGAENTPIVAVERMVGLEVVALLTLALLLWRSAARLRGHFHDRHYRPLSEVTPADPSGIRDAPLSWWAVRRVMEYSGRSNLYLAGGFGIVYAAYTVAGDQWPSWLGQLVFLIFERIGGVPLVTTALVMLAAVPAAYQYGLWDSSTQDRCRRLELLLLTGLESRDYYEAALAAAWKRGRGYLVVAIVLWLALAISGKATIGQVLASAASAGLLWVLYFVAGFRAFSSGWQANGLGSLLTLGMPAVTFLLYSLAWHDLASLTPPGSVYAPLTGVMPVAWLVGPLLMAGLAWWLSKAGLRRCDGELRAWYDRHHGTRGAD